MKLKNKRELGINGNTDEWMPSYESTFFVKSNVYDQNLWVKYL